MTMRDFEGKVVLVTGGSSGLGAAACVEFARRGAKVVVAARRKAHSDAVVRQIAEAGGEGFFVQTDVSKSADIQAMVAQTVEKFKRLDCAFNNAGITGPTLTPVAEIDEKGWDETMAVNLKAVWLCMKYEILAMLKAGKGAIVNCSSMYGVVAGDVGHAAYCASKFAVIGLTKVAAVDYGQQGIRVNAVSPGFVHSEMVDPYVENAPELMKALTSRHSAMNRLGEASEVAAGVAWLCSDAASFVNGTVLRMDGGETTRLY
jgi:NAD(P)-dependent dehydrogenase (short-subunit alcohol dehydrogenase family)